MGVRGAGARHYDLSWNLTEFNVGFDKFIRNGLVLSRLGLVQRSMNIGPKGSRIELRLLEQRENGWLVVITRYSRREMGRNGVDEMSWS